MSVFYRKFRLISTKIQFKALHCYFVGINLMSFNDPYKPSYNPLYSFELKTN